jgi:hypothetical protein
VVYNTPELLLVGAAQNLVLSITFTKDVACEDDNPSAGQNLSEYSELW